MLDFRQSPQYAAWMRILGWKTVEILNPKSEIRNFVYVRRIPILGSVIKFQRTTGPIPFRSLEKIAEKERAILVKVEPDISQNQTALLKQLEKHHYRQDKWALLVTKTLRVNLSLPDNQIFSQFKKDSRATVRKALAQKLRVEENNFEKLYQLLKKSYQRKKLWFYPKDQYNSLIRSFGENVFGIDLLAPKAEEPVAGCLVLISDKTASYLLAGSLPEGQEMHAPYLVVWEAMKEAKKRGCTTWDFEGIKDERIPSTKNWGGFTHFKKSFGGYEVTFPGSFTWYRNPILKFLSFFSP